MRITNSKKNSLPKGQITVYFKCIRMFLLRIFANSFLPGIVVAEKMSYVGEFAETMYSWKYGI